MKQSTVDLETCFIFLRQYICFPSVYCLLGMIAIDKWYRMIHHEKQRKVHNKIHQNCVPER